MIGKILRLVSLYGDCILRGLVKIMPVEFKGNELRAWYYAKRFYAFGQETIINEGCEVFSPELIQVGSRTIVGRYSELNPGPSSTKPCLVIGDDCGFGPYCFFRTSNHRFDDPTIPFLKQGHEELSIHIGNDVWAGAHTIFLPGTKVGDHCVIAAGSVLSGAYPALSIIAGNPARVVKLRKTKTNE